MLEQECMLDEQSANSSSVKDVLSILVGVHPVDTVQLTEDLQRFGVDLAIPAPHCLSSFPNLILELPRGRRLVLDEKRYLYSVKNF